MGTRIVRLTISVEELPRALALYEGVLGLTRRYAVEGLVMLATDSDPGGSGIEVLLHERIPATGDAGVAPSFTVADVDAATEAAVEAGAVVVDEPADQEWGERQSVIRDADGHVLCLVAPL